MTRLYLAVISDEAQEFSGPEELEDELSAILKDYGCRGTLMAVRRGGLLAYKVLDMLPPVRHKDQGVYR